MQRAATKTTRGQNADERRLMMWVKDQPCCICNNAGPSIVDHMYGATFKHNKVLVGHYALLPYCYEYDRVKTDKGRGEHDSVFGIKQADLWGIMAGNYHGEIPDDVKLAIEGWGR